MSVVFLPILSATHPQQTHPMVEPMKKKVAVSAVYVATIDSGIYMLSPICFTIYIVFITTHDERDVWGEHHSIEITHSGD